jgi:uncharacterized protein YaaR (DUF327 family)
LLLVAIVSLFMSFRATQQEMKTNQKLTAFVRCQAEWTSFLYKANQAGRNANANTQRAMDDLVNAVGEAKSEEDTRAALARYKKARAEQNLSLEQNPLPPPPEQVCSLG